MKYILLICSLFILISGIVIYTLYSSENKVDQIDVAIKINDRVISKEELSSRFAHRSSHLHDIDDFVQSVISKELFIQEAQKLKIDQEDEFRHAIQNFYEQSLIRLLMDRKMESLNIRIDDEKIVRYAYLMDKQMEFTIWELDSLKGLEKEITVSALGKGETIQAAFQDLSGDLKCIISGLRENELSQPNLIKTDMLSSQYILVQLKKVSPKNDTIATTINNKRIREWLTTNQQQGELNEWVENLKKSADIQLMVDLNDPHFVQELKKGIPKR